MDHTIVSRLKSLAAEERRITTEILQLLMKVEDLRIFAEMGYPSLYEFCRRELSYSEGSAYRRISAMRLMRGNSGVGEKLVSGEMSLTTATQVQTALSKLKKAKVKVSVAKRAEIVRLVESKSKREVEKLLVEQVSALAPQLADKVRESERVTACGDGMCRLELVLSESLMEQMTELLAELSHALPSGKYLDLIRYLVKERERKLQERGRRKSEKKMREVAGLENLCKEKEWEGLNAGVKSISHLSGEVRREPVVEGCPRRHESDGGVGEYRHLERTKVKTRFIPANAKRSVRIRDGNQCGYVGPKAGKKCESNHFLQFDHVVPVAHGGNASEENLRLLCATHNQLAARKMGLSL